MAIEALTEPSIFNNIKQYPDARYPLLENNMQCGSIIILRIEVDEWSIHWEYVTWEKLKHKKHVN